MAAHKRVDYDRIEAGWRAGLLSPHQLAAAYIEETGEQVSHAAIIKHFKKAGVPRNLAAKIKAKSDAMVTAAMVTEKVTKETIRRDAEIVDDGAAVLTAVRLGHRKDINRARGLANKLLDELESLTDEQGTIKSLIKAFKEEDHEDSDAMSDMLALANKIGALPSRTKTMKELAETMKTLITLERDAFDIAPPSKIEMTGANGTPLQAPTLNVATLSTAALEEIMKAKDAANAD